MTLSVVAETQISRNGIEVCPGCRNQRKYLLRNRYRSKRPDIITAQTMVIVKKAAGAVIVELAIEYMIHVTHRRGEIDSQPAAVYPVRWLQIESEIVVKAIFENYSRLPFTFITGSVAYAFPGKA